MAVHRIVTACIQSYAAVADYEYVQARDPLVASSGRGM